MSFHAPVMGGFRGIWYGNQATGDEYAYKYSGGLATYPQQHAPIALHAPGVEKTFFVYGGTDTSGRVLHHVIAEWDAKTGEGSEPRNLLTKDTDDAHDNPVLSIDPNGRLLVFCNTHGQAPRPSRLFRSLSPHDIGEWEELPLPGDVFPEHRFAYAQPWRVNGKGLLLPHTRYAANNAGRETFFTTSPDGETWTPVRPLSALEAGQYQISTCDGRRVALAQNLHPHEGVFNARCNLYYLQSADFGETWTTAGGDPVDLPLREDENPARILETRSRGELVYLKDIRFAPGGHPVLLYLLSTSPWPGPLDPPRRLRTARWTGTDWVHREVLTTTHNYDFGSLLFDPDGTWRLIGAFLPGPQHWGTGGEVGIWTSSDQGTTWTLAQVVTRNSEFNHTYVRRVEHGTDGFAVLWADGDAYRPSPSRLYLMDRRGRQVTRLPDPSRTFSTLTSTKDLPR